MSQCPFCRAQMEMVGRGGVGPDTWACPVCEAERVYGWTELPDPDALRRRAGDLERLADEVENSELAARMEVSR